MKIKYCAGLLNGLGDGGAGEIIIPIMGAWIVEMYRYERIWRGKIPNKIREDVMGVNTDCGMSMLWKLGGEKLLE